MRKLTSMQVFPVIVPMCSHEKLHLLSLINCGDGCADTGTLTLCFCRFLGHLYAAEALISLDRISDAITHLNPENVTDVSLGISSNEQDQG